MNDFPGLFPTDFGLKARGKAAPMVPPLKPYTNLSSGSNFNFDSHPHPPASSSRSSAPLGGPLDHSSSFPDLKSRDSRSKPGDAFNLDWSSNEKSAAPVFDKPIYDDDNFDGVAGMKNFASTNYDDLLSTISPPQNDGNDFVDLLATLGKSNMESQNAPRQRSETEASMPGFDDLIPGFGAGGSSGRSSTRGEPEITRGSSKTTSGPFIVLESGSPPNNSTTQQPVKNNRPSRSNADTSSQSNEDQGHTAPSRSFEKTSRDSSGWNPAHEANKGGAACIPSRSGGNSDPTDDVWLTVSDIPLFTQETTAPPPSRPPPPKPVQAPNQENNLVDDTDGMNYAAASTAAMKEAMDMAEAKFRQVRERENMKAVSRNRDGGVSWERDDTGGDQERARQEQSEREREEEERMRRAEREKEKAKEIERARHLVERATREARERAATEARLKAERAAVEKANAEARERAERQAVQRALAEARERAARDAREKAQKASAAAAVAAAAVKAAAEAQGRTVKMENDVESFFGAGSRPSSAPKARVHPSSSEGAFDGVAPPFHSSRQSTSSDAAGRATAAAAAASAARGGSSSMRKASSTTSIIDDLSSVLRGPHSGDFQEVDGETEDRRKIRLQRHQKTQERAAHALAEKNERDLQAQRDQAERNRFSDTLDAEIRRWAAGKQGNLRALLASLHYVLWPDCGWQPVSMGDLIESAQAKKVYRKATLYVHPDKVQQRGATLQQKYIAEKVFDLLKEAFNKLNSEELC